MNKLQAEYLGDAVYAISEPDGSIILRVNSHKNEAGQIFLEPSVLDNLDGFRKRVTEIRNRAAAIDKFHPGMGVTFFPKMPPGQDVTGEPGIVSSKNHMFVFVKFLCEGDNRTFDEMPSQACNPLNLVITPPKEGEEVE